MAIVLLFILGIIILVVLGFFAVNKWSSPGRDRAKSADLRANRQMGGSERESRGTGIN
jgi:predicted transporter